MDEPNPIERLEQVIKIAENYDSPAYYSDARLALAKVAAFIHSARNSAQNHRSNHRPYSQLMSIEMDAEELIPQGLDGDPELKEFVSLTEKAKR